MRRLLVVAIVACSADGEPLPTDATYYGPPPEAGESMNCVAATYGGDPLTSCFARWDCLVEGTVTLVCGADIGSQGAGCVCDRAGLDPLVVGTPNSCVDIAMLTAFARQACGWSFL